MANVLPSSPSRQAGPLHPPDTVLFRTSVLWRYLPVRILALLGQQIGVVTKALLKSAPASLRSLRAATRGVAPPSTESWSSVKMRTMFGLGLEEAARQRRPRRRCRREEAMLGEPCQEEAMLGFTCGKSRPLSL